MGGECVLTVFFRLLFAVLMALFISACQSLPETPASKAEWLDNPDYFSARFEQVQQQQTWRYSAKVGLTTPQAREQANLVWEFGDQANSVRLFGPLGVGAIKLEFDQYGVVLSDNKGVIHQGKSAEELLTRIVGWPIPIDALSSWIFVLPNKNAAFRYTLDENQNVKSLEQLGWLIEYSAYKEYEGRLMPRKVTATRQLPYSSSADTKDSVVVKLITKNWE